MKIQEFLNSLFAIRINGHIAHLQTNNFAQHKALEELYTGIVDLTDSYVETYQGIYGVITDYRETISVKNNQDMVKYLTEERDKFREYRKDVSQTELQQKIDDIIEFLDTIIYKLKELFEKGGKIAKVMHEFKAGKLFSSSGKKVTDKKQALAIALSEERRLEDGGEVDEDLYDIEVRKTSDSYWESINRKGLPKAAADAIKKALDKLGIYSDTRVEVPLPFENGGSVGTPNEDISRVVSAIFSLNEKNGKVETEAGNKTEEGLFNLIADNDASYSASAIFNSNERDGKITTDFGVKTFGGLQAMIAHAKAGRLSSVAFEDGGLVKKKIMFGFF